MLSWDDFEVELRRLHNYASNSGTEALHAAGFSAAKARDFENFSPRAMKIFIRGCHYGFARAQADIGRHVVQIRQESKQIIASLVIAKRERNVDLQSVYKAQLSILKRQERLFRRVLDEVLRQIIGTDTWILRRLKLYEEERDVNPDVLAATLQEAWDRNREDRMTFHLVTDLLSAVHVGDIIRINMRAEPGQKWSIIELKSGIVNEELQNLLNAAPPDTSSESIELQAAAIKPTADKQVRRMMRQTLRQKRVEEIIRTDKGIDPTHDVPITLHDAPRDTEGYLEAIRKISLDLNTKDISSITVEGCIHLLGVKEIFLNEFGVGFIRHHFYHRTKFDSPCLLKGTEVERQNELVSLTEFDFHDLIDVNLFANWAITFFQWPMPEENLFHLALGRHRIFAYIDYDALFERARKRGIEMTPIPKDLKGVKEDDRQYLNRMSYPLPGFRNARGLKVRSKSGHEIIFFSGFVVRLLAEQMMPNYWLELLERTFELHERQTKGKHTAG
jgi:hypothetical protein